MKCACVFTNGKIASGPCGFHQFYISPQATELLAASVEEKERLLERIAQLSNENDLLLQNKLDEFSLALVPKEPTPEMLNAFMRGWSRYMPDGDRQEYFTNGYKEMLAACSFATTPDQVAAEEQRQQSWTEQRFLKRE